VKALELIEVTLDALQEPELVVVPKRADDEAGSVGEFANLPALLLVHAHEAVNPSRHERVKPFAHISPTTPWWHGVLRVEPWSDLGEPALRLP
jgi:hypothetical protein